jgi:tRNA(Ile)-lysidine synthase
MCDIFVAKCLKNGAPLELDELSSKKIINTMLKLIDKVYTYIKKNNLVNKGDNIGIAISGGKDSVVLLDILHKLMSRLKCTLKVVHINHHQRGKESDHDEKFVSELARKKYNLLYVLGHVYIKDKSNLEEKLRDARYKKILELAKKNSINKIALAHSQNDQTETIFFRFINGAGLKGLSAMKPMRDNLFIRPLLNTSSDEIYSYVNKNNLKFVTDSQNLNNNFTRNKIRNIILPFISKNLKCNLNQSLSQSAYLLGLAHDYFDQIALAAQDKLVRKEHGCLNIKYDQVIKLPKIIQYYLIKKCVTYFKKDEKETRFDLIDKIVDKLSCDNASFRISIGNGLIFEKGYNIIRVGKKIKEFKINELKLKIGSKINCINFNDTKIELKRIKNKFVNICNNKNNYYINGDLITDSLQIRYFKEGDRFKPLGMKNEKKLQDCFVDRKIPRLLRGKIPLLMHGNNIILVPGYTINEDYKVKKDTKELIEIGVFQDSYYETNA